MRRASLAGVLLVAAACLPQAHDLVGRACTADADCGRALICHLRVCAAPGTLSRVSLDAAALALAGADQGGATVGAAGVSRMPTAPGLAAAVASNPLSSGRFGHAAVAAAGHVWLLGGKAGADPTAEVLDVAVLESRAPVPGPALPSARWALAATAAAGRVFALGGRGADGALLTEVLSAAVQPDGTLGAWDVEPSLPSGRAALAAVAAGGWVYAVGGQTLGGLSADVLAAPVLGSGRLGAFARVGSLPATHGGARASFAAAVFEGRLHLVGGSCASGQCPTVRAALQADGSLGPFERLADLPERLDAAATVAGGSLVVFGGRRSTGVVLNEVWALPLDSAGRAPWQSQPDLAHPLVGAAAVAVPSGALLTGGAFSDGGLSTQSWVASSRVSGLAAFTDQLDAPDDLQGASLAVWNGNLYLGGSVTNQGPTDHLFRARFTAPDGGLDGWAMPTHLPRRSGRFGLTAWGSRLYFIGRCELAGTDCLAVDGADFLDLAADGGIGAAAALTPLPAQTAAAGVAVVNGTLYAVGGEFGYSGGHAEVRLASLDPATGRPGPWRDTTPLPLAMGLRGHATVAVGEVLYLVGGALDGTPFGGYSDQVFSGRLSPDGTVASWVLVGHLPQPRSWVSATTFDDTLYVMGGCNERNNMSYCGNDEPTVLSAAIRLDGGLGDFAVVNQLSGRNDLAATTLNGQAVVAGGYNGNAQRWVQTARYQARGTVGAVSSMPSLSTARSDFAAAAHAHWVFAVGGSGAASSVEQAPVSSSGAGAWKPGPALPAPRTRLSAAVLGERLYVVGGADGSSMPTSTVWSAAVTAQGLGDFRVEAPLPKGLSGLAVAASHTALYVTGGEGSAAVFFATAGFDGVLASWQSGPALPGARASHRAVVASGQLWVLGGVAEGDSGDVLSASLSPDDSVGEWRRSIGLPGHRAALGAVAASGVLYVAGGLGSLGSTADVLAASVRPDGTLGSWSEVGSLGAGRFGHELVAVDGWLLSLGGAGRADVQGAALLTAPARASYAVRVDLGHQASRIDAVTLSGTTGPGTFFVDARFAGDDGVFGPPVALGQARAGQPLAVGQPGHFVWLQVTLDDVASASGPLPGVSQDLTGVSFDLTVQPEPAL